MAHQPQNSKALGWFHNDPPPKALEVHDTFTGHTAQTTEERYWKAALATAVVAANCTGFLQWNDVYAHRVYIIHDFSQKMILFCRLS